MRHAITLCTTLYLALNPGGPGTARAAAPPVPPAPATPAALRAAVERTLPLLASEGDRWIKERGCVSCHQIPSLLWSQDQARRRGLAVDARKLADWQRFAQEQSPVRNIGLDTLSALLLGHATGDREAAIRARIRDAQNPDGSWSPGGQRTIPEITTAWTWLAMGPGEATARARGLAYLKGVTPNQNLEALVLRTLVAHQSGDRAQASTRLAAVLRRQHPDGGWGYRPEARTSDPYATGIALYVLDELAGLPGASAAADQGRRYLLQTQRRDGTWLVRGLWINGKNTSAATMDVIYTYWGSAWAVLGLLGGLPPPTPAALSSTARR